MTEHPCTLVLADPVGCATPAGRASSPGSSDSGSFLPDWRAAAIRAAGVSPQAFPADHWMAGSVTHACSVTTYSGDAHPYVDEPHATECCNTKPSATESYK